MIDYIAVPAFLLYLRATYGHFKSFLRIVTSILRKVTIHRSFRVLDTPVYVLLRLVTSHLRVVAKSI